MKFDDMTSCGWQNNKENFISNENLKRKVGEVWITLDIDEKCMRKSIQVLSDIRCIGERRT